MNRMNRTLLTIMLVSVPALLTAQGSEDDHGWSFAQRFQGSSNAAGVVLKDASTATFSFNEHFKLYAGVPFYFTRQASSSGGTNFVNGIGNVYSGLFLSTGNAMPIHYSSDLVFTAPTGDIKNGFSTGHPTVDWTNTFSHSFTALTPYASAGIANTVSDTAFFVRPFTSKGIVSHFEAGALMNLAPRVSIGGSAYAIRATGEQEIISKVVEAPAPVSTPASTPVSTQSGSTPQPTSATSSAGNVLSGVTKTLGVGNGGTNSSNGNKDVVPPIFQTQQQTLGPAQVANDQGFASWLTVRPSSLTDLQIGYSRSSAYHFNTLFFGIGFRIGHGVSVIK